MTDENHKLKGELTAKFRSHSKAASQPNFLTNAPLSRVNGEWKAAQDQGRALDPRLIEIVRLLARRAARLDYEQFVRKLLQSRKIRGGEEGAQ